MAENKNADVELIDEDEVITLYDDDNKPVKFYEVAVIEYASEYYALMQPVEPMEGLGEDEALIFKIRAEDDDTDVFEPVTDESVLEAVFDEYLKAVADSDDCCCDGDVNEWERSCGCDCGCEHESCDEKDECEHDDCDCGCGHEHKNR